MSYYLNKGNDKFLSYYNDVIFVDKSMMIDIINRSFNKESFKYMCVTRPRRFGKTMALSMLNAYYSKGCDSKEIFDKLEISKDDTYLKHLNKHNVILIDMASLYTKIEHKDNFVKELKNYLIKDFKESFPSINYEGLRLEDVIIKIKSTLNEKFIFLIDEWDVIFREQETNTKLCNEYTNFLRNLFKSFDVSECIDLVYMTGILPIKRYRSESALNMFREYNMIDPCGLESYFGFTEEETKTLCAEYDMDFDEIKAWYDGYKLNGNDIYNPKSVVEALITRKCKDHWVNTSARESVMEYMNYDNGALKDLIVKMLSGEEIKVDVRKFGNDLTKINSSDAALTVLIHLGYLAYDEGKGKCYIPNHEIKEEFERAIRDLKWNNIYNPISTSEELLEKTLSGDTGFINEIIMS